MTLAAGAKLGPYEVVALLGAGGMGEVYRARDTRLDRDVAIKILPDSLSRDRERTLRFEREAKLMASVNHPKIAQIYGFEESGAQKFLVLEYVEGHTLAARLQRGPLTVNEALEVAAQMAEALEAAHEKGIVHRDLKPGNVMLRTDGSVKVLDFGLARAMGEEANSGQLPSQSPTITADFTRPGLILGTAAYMSPEQARGRPIDKRTDIWSLGVILCECLCGVNVFQGETITDSVGAILHKDPQWELLPSETPPTIRLLLHRCLAKDRNRRFRDAGDVCIELEQAMTDPTGASVGFAKTAAAAMAPRRYRVVPLLAALLFTALVAGATGWVLNRQAPTTTRKFDLGIRHYEPDQGLAISPYGTKVVYSHNHRLWIREFDKLEPQELLGTDGASQPTWSPDGTRIAYAVEHRVWHISAHGGLPTAVGALPTAMLPVGGISWTEDDRILLATGNTGLHEVSARGGEVRTILAVDPHTEEDFHHAAALPGGRGVLFTVHKKGGGPDTIDLWTPTGRKTLLTLPGERFDNPVYSGTGHVIYSRSTKTPGLWALPFRLDTLEATGEPFLIVSDASRPAVSTDGTLLFCRGTMRTMAQMIWVNREGKMLETAGQPQAILQNPRLSPDGTRIAVDAQDPDSRNIWVHELERRTKMRLTFDQTAPVKRPLWIHGRDEVAYSTGSGGEGPAFVRSADGSGEARKLPISNPTSCSRDGKFLLFGTDDGDDDIGYVANDDGKPASLIVGENEDRNAEFSPDGTLLAYEHRDAGAAQEEIFLTTFPSAGGRWQVSINSGTAPRWSPRGDEIFYIEPSSFSLMSVAVTREPKLTLGSPRMLFSGLNPGVALYAGYDVSDDAQRFVMVQISDPEASKQGIAVVQNWFTEFQQRP